MSFNDTIQKALASAREMQRSAAEAVAKANDQMQPLIQESLRHAADLQSTLSKQAGERGAMAQQQAQVALDHLNTYMKMGSDALSQSADQARVVAQQMAEQSRKIVDSATAAMAKGPDKNQ